MAFVLLDSDNVEIACPRCGMTTPKTTVWLRANDRYVCPACNFEVNLDRDKQLT